MPVLLALFEHRSAPEVLLRGEGVVSRTIEREVFDRGRAAAREGGVMVQLESLGFAATHAARVDVGAAMTVTFEDCVAYGGRHGAPALARRVSGRLAA